MRRRIYWGIGALIIVLLCVSTFLLMRNTDTSPEKVYIVDKDTVAKSKTPAAKPGHKIVQHSGHSHEVPLSDPDVSTPNDKSAHGSVEMIETGTPTQSENETPVETDKVADVPVSPHGFGSYPEIPDDFTARSPFWINQSRSAELLSRVLIKLWTEGEKDFRGGIIHQGKVYPWYHNTVYVRFRNYENDDGEIVRRAGFRMSGPNVKHSGIDYLNPPPHIRIIDLDIESIGIDPYEYLDLPFKK